MVYSFFNKKLLSSSVLALSFFLGNPEVKAMEEGDFNKNTRKAKAQKHLEEPGVPVDWDFVRAEGAPPNRVVTPVTTVVIEEAPKIEELPKVLIAYILRFLDPYSLLQVSRVSKSMYTISNFDICWEGRRADIIECIDRLNNTKNINIIK